MKISSYILLQYHCSLRLICIGGVIGSGVRFSRKASDGFYHIHNPSNGAIWLLSITMAVLVLSFIVVPVRLHFRPEPPIDERVKRLIKNKTQRALDIIAIPFFLFGLIAGVLSTNDIGWAVSDAVSCLSLGFLIWCVWSFVESMETCMSQGVNKNDKNAKVAISVETRSNHRIVSRLHENETPAERILHQKQSQTQRPRTSLRPRQVRNPLEFNSVCAR